MGQSSSSSSSCHAFSATQTLNTHQSKHPNNNLINHTTQCDLTLGIPDECLALIFSHLSCPDRNSCSAVCTRWRMVDAKSRHRLVLVARIELSHALPSILFRFSSVSVLSLRCSRKLISIDDNSLSLIPTHLHSLKKLKLKGCADVSDEGLHAFALKHPPSLEKVSFASCGFGAKGIVSLLYHCPTIRDLTLKRLRKLDSQNTPISIEVYEETRKDGKKVSVLKDKEKAKENCFVERLCIKDLHNARLFIPLISSSKNLKTLVVCRSSGNWDRVLEDSLNGETRQQHPTGIMEIQMENVQMGDAGLMAIASSCADLEVLYLSRVTDCTDDGLLEVAGSCRKLRKFHIDSWSRFGGRSIGDEGVTILGSRCSQLQEVVLMGVPVRIPSLNVMASNCSHLERMALCNTDTVGDPEMAVIAEKFSALKKLCIKNCPISDKGIEAVVGGCSNLVKLKVKRCKGVTRESVSRLRMLKRGLVISVDAGSLLFDGEAAVGRSENERQAATETEEEGTSRTRSSSRTRTGTGIRTRTSSNTTHVICSSRSALLLRSKFVRTASSSHTRYATSIDHAGATSRQPPLD